MKDEKHWMEEMMEEEEAQHEAKLKEHGNKINVNGEWIFPWEENNNGTLIHGNLVGEY